MADKFKGSMFGYAKNDVKEKIIELEKAKSFLEQENKTLKEQIENMKAEYAEKYSNLEKAAQMVEESKKRIADAYIDAQKTADNIVEQAKSQVAMERHVYQIENESLRDIIVERKEAIRNIRLSVQSFGTELEEYFNRVVKNLSSDIDTAVKQLDYEHLEKFSVETDFEYDRFDAFEDKAKTVDKEHEMRETENKEAGVSEETVEEEIKETETIENIHEHILQAEPEILKERAQMEEQREEEEREAQRVAEYLYK